jgi:GT2 family glycosyltransferase
LAYWHSAKDRGHWDAVRQGFEKATGDILYFLNSDDLLLDHAVTRVVDAFRSHPEAGMIYGKAKFIDGEGRYIQDYPSGAFEIARVFATWENPVPQPSAFLRREVFEKYGGPDETWEFCADFEYWIRISEEVQFLYLPEYLSSMRIHSAAKTSRLESVHAQELIRLCERAIKSDRFAQTGVDPAIALQSAYLRASMRFRQSGKKRDALHAYYIYCKNAFSPPVALYRFSRYLAGIILHRW